MKPSEDIKPISYFKAHASEVIKDVSNNHKTLIITQNGKAKVVVQDIQTFGGNSGDITLNYSSRFTFLN